MRGVPISRPLLIALIGVVLVAAAVLLARGGDDAASTASVTPTAPDTLQAAEPPPDGKVRSSAKADAGGRQERHDGLPRKVSRALERGQLTVVVLLQPGAGDDALTASNVRAVAASPGRWVREDGNLKIFPDRLANAAEYVDVTTALGMTQAPAAIVLKPNGSGRLLQGFTDASSLRQHLTDALR